MKTIGIIGGGNMGEALIKGLQKTNRIFVSESSPERIKFLKKKYSLTMGDVGQTVNVASIIILAVKPQDMLTALEQVKQVKGVLEDKLFISIAAGLTTKFFEHHLGRVRIIRCMPNMPALIAEGITGICSGKNVKSIDLKLAQTILGCIGQTLVVKEGMMDAVTAVSGSGPAYVFLFVEQWIASAKAVGFNDADAKALVYKTLIGSAHLLEQSSWSAAELRAKVTSKGGTTQAALDVFTNNKFNLIFKQAIQAAKQRAKELK